jgi:sugar fermentation stimulation protein A
VLQVSERAQKHVKELMNVLDEGHEAICMFVIQRGDCTHFAPSFEKDSKYAKLILEVRCHIRTALKVAHLSDCILDIINCTGRIIHCMRRISCCI